MRYSVKWLPEAEFTFKLVISYLEENWSAKEIIAFIERTNDVIENIRNRPKQYIYSQKKDAYRVVVTKHTSLFYRIKINQIELLTFWDNRQDPQKLNL